MARVGGAVAGEARGAGTAGVDDRPAAPSARDMDGAMDHLGADLDGGVARGQRGVGVAAGAAAQSRPVPQRPGRRSRRRFEQVLCAFWSALRGRGAPTVATRGPGPGQARAKVWQSPTLFLSIRGDFFTRRPHPRCHHNSPLSPGRIVIAGGGLAAQRCAETLRRAGYDGAIRIVSRRAAPALRSAAAVQGAVWPAVRRASLASAPRRVVRVARRRTAARRRRRLSAGAGAHAGPVRRRRAALSTDC